jgi:hypothetical protein
MLPVPEGIGTDSHALTSDALLGARLPAMAPEESAVGTVNLTVTPEKSRTATPTALASLTVTPEQITHEKPPSLTSADSPDSASSDSSTKIFCAETHAAMLEQKGLRGKFLHFLEKEARTKRRSLTELRRRSAASGSDGEMQAKILAMSDKIYRELSTVEDLVLESREALINEHLEVARDRRLSSEVSSTISISSASSGSTPAPTHWRSRVRRATPLARRADLCASPACKREDIKRDRSSVDSKISKESSLSHKSLTEKYCEKVENRVKPLINPIDRVLGKISNFVHGPAPQKKQQTISADRRTSAQLRKEVAREFWGYMACGACVVDNRNGCNIPSFPAGPGEGRKTDIFQDVHIETIMKIEAQLETDTQSHLAKIKNQLAQTGSFHGSPDTTPFFASEIEVPASSLQIDRAVEAVVPKHAIAEAVVELANAGARGVDAHYADKSAMAHTRSLLYDSLGSARMGQACKKLAPQADPASPSTPMPTSASSTPQGQPIFFLAAKESDSPSTPQPTPRLWGTPMATHVEETAEEGESFVAVPRHGRAFNDHTSLGCRQLMEQSVIV